MTQQLIRGNDSVITGSDTQSHSPVAYCMFLRTWVRIVTHGSRAL